MNRLLADVDSIPGETESKVVAVGLTKLLTETPEMLSDYVSLWGPAMTSLVKLFECDAEGEDDEENHLVDLESKGYQAAFAKLAFSGKADHDPFAGVCLSLTPLVGPPANL